MRKLLFISSYFIHTAYFMRSFLHTVQINDDDDDDDDYAVHYDNQ